MTHSPTPAPFDSDIQRAMRAIVAYLHSHQHSADTADGVCQWWLGGAYARAVVDIALDRLARDGAIVRVDAGNRQLWRRAAP
jgi:hypothetical protein